MCNHLDLSPNTSDLPCSTAKEATSRDPTSLTPGELKVAAHPFRLQIRLRAHWRCGKLGHSPALQAVIRQNKIPIPPQAVDHAATGPELDMLNQAFGCLKRKTTGRVWTLVPLLVVFGAGQVVVQAVQRVKPEFDRVAQVAFVPPRE